MSNWFIENWLPSFKTSGRSYVQLVSLTCCCHTSSSFHSLVAVPTCSSFTHLLLFLRAAHLTHLLLSYVQLISLLSYVHLISLPCCCHTSSSFHSLVVVPTCGSFYSIVAVPMCSSCNSLVAFTASNTFHPLVDLVFYCDSVTQSRWFTFQSIVAVVDLVFYCDSVAVAE